jgi:signal transduction histidine kinase
MRYHLSDSAPTTDVSAAELIVHDALDGAIALALASLTEQVEEAREEFLATTMHDVRQPITSMKASAQFAARMLNRPQPDVAAALEALESADAAAEQMSLMLDRLSRASRLSLGRLELDRGTVDLVEVVDGALGRLDPDNSKRVTFASDAERVSGHWDRVALDEVVANLISNAVKYSAPDARIEILIETAPDVVELTIHDNGIGLEPDQLQQLFRRYSRGPEAAVHQVDGLGLGLYLARGIVEAHGGRIWAESPGSGQGATFHVILPRGVPAENS